MLPPLDELEIRPQDLSEHLRNPAGEAIRLVDCRDPSEYVICRIEGAELVPLSQFAAEVEARGLIDESRPVVVYCHHGMRSLRATNYLRQRGLAQVWSLSGGIEQWSLEVDPTVARY